MTRTITVTYSFTRRDEPCEPSGDLFIDYNGQITQTASPVNSIVLRGGYSLSKHTISELQDLGYTLSVNQRKALMQVLKSIASRTDSAQISSPVGDLHEICNAIYKNYCG